MRNLDEHRDRWRRRNERDARVGRRARDRRRGRRHAHDAHASTQMRWQAAAAKTMLVRRASSGGDGSASGGSGALGALARSKLAQSRLKLKKNRERRKGKKRRGRKRRESTVAPATRSLGTVEEAAPKRPSRLRRTGSRSSVTERLLDVDVGENDDGLAAIEAALKRPSRLRRTGSRPSVTQRLIDVENAGAREMTGGVLSVRRQRANSNATIHPHPSDLPAELPPRRLAFCGGCGTQFSSETAGFCGVCGERRPS